MNELINTMNLSMMQFHILLVMLMIVLHIVIATAIAKDISLLAKRQIFPQLLPGLAWVLVGLLTGVWGLVVYWLMHHSSLSRF
ncbi:MAG: hypothetical protein NTV32_09050 [Gammaproteobacteria bacterium]|nr:hypothetical protein [Gammaproteobacteria bacterium]